MNENEGQREFNHKDRVIDLNDQPKREPPLRGRPRTLGSVHEGPFALARQGLGDLGQERLVLGARHDRAL
jgi:hypothetical protein